MKADLQIPDVCEEREPFSVKLVEVELPLTALTAWLTAAKGEVDLALWRDEKTFELRCRTWLEADDYDEIMGRFGIVRKGEKEVTGDAAAFFAS